MGGDIHDALGIGISVSHLTLLAVASCYSMNVKIGNDEVLNFRWNRKAARLSSALCGCFPPADPCVLCSGRVNNTQNHPDVCIQSKWDRAAILDQSFHPVLSDRNSKLSNFNNSNFKHLKVCDKGGFSLYLALFS